MNAFIAWTPLHIINIINTVVNFFPNQQNDLYIYDEFDNADKIYENLINEDIFTNVYLVSHKKMEFFLGKAISILINRQKHIEHSNIYDDIFIQGGNYFSKILYGETRVKNPDVKLHYIEDGLGAYVDSPIIRIDTKMKKLMKLANKNSMYNSKIENYYVYEPALIPKKNENHYFALPKLTQENPALQLIKSVFGKEDLKFNTEMKPIIYFDQPLLEDGYSISEIDTYRLIKENVNQNEILVKFHPRSSKDKYGQIASLNTTLPWELFCLNTKMDTSMLLISVATTASFTPYLMFGDKVPVILLTEYYLKKATEKKMNQKTVEMLKNIVNFSYDFMNKTGATLEMPKDDNELALLLASKIESEED